MERYDYWEGNYFVNKEIQLYFHYVISWGDKRRPSTDFSAFTQEVMFKVVL